jgi:hypothetical protein
LKVRPTNAARCPQRQHRGLQALPVREQADEVCVTFSAPHSGIRGPSPADGLGRCVGLRFGFNFQGQGMINFSVRFPVREQA